MLLNVTFAGNSVRAGSSVWKPADDEPASPGLGSSIYGGVEVTLTNTILACAPDQVNVWGRLKEGGHNICSDGSANFTMPSSRNNLDPLLGPLGDYGGPTPTVPLLPASPAVGAADSSMCPPTDQRGVARPQGLGCDIGAFELAPKLTLTRAPGGQPTLQYTFQAAQTNRIWASTNLTDWEALATQATDANGAFEYHDNDAWQLPRRFFFVKPVFGQ